MVLGRPLRFLPLSALLPLLSSLSADYCSDAEREAESATLRCPLGLPTGLWLELAGLLLLLPWVMGTLGARWARSPETGG